MKNIQTVNDVIELLNIYKKMGWGNLPVINEENKCGLDHIAGPRQDGTIKAVRLIFYKTK